MNVDGVGSKHIKAHIIHLEGIIHLQDMLLNSAVLDGNIFTAVSIQGFFFLAAQEFFSFSVLHSLDIKIHSLYHLHIKSILIFVS